MFPEAGSEVAPDLYAARHPGKTGALRGVRHGFAVPETVRLQTRRNQRLGRTRRGGARCFFGSSKRNLRVVRGAGVRVRVSQKNRGSVAAERDVGKATKTDGVADVRRVGEGRIPRSSRRGVGSHAHRENSQRSVRGVVQRAGAGLSHLPYQETTDCPYPD